MKKFVRLFGFAVVFAVLLITGALADKHVYPDKWDIEVPPTCESEGKQIRRCLNCSFHERRTIAQLDHYYVPATCKEPKHCINGCKQTIGDTLPHTLVPATCIRPQSCRDCDYEQGGLGKHNFVSTNCLEPKVCTVCTLESKELTSHEYTDATCQKPATCKRCGDETGGKANHSFPKVSCTMVAKCRWCEKTQRGEHQWVTEGKERTCSVCQIAQALKQPKPETVYTEQ